MVEKEEETKNKKIEEEIKEPLVKKQKVNQKDIQNKGKSKKVKGFKSEYRDNFANDVVKTIPGVTRVDSNNKVLLKLNNYLIARLMLRKSHRFTAYRNNEQGRDSVKITNDGDEAKLKTWIEQRVAELKTKKITEESKPR